MTLTNLKTAIVLPAVAAGLALMPSCKNAPAPEGSPSATPSPAPAASATPAQVVASPSATPEAPAATPPTAADAAAPIELKDPVAVVNGEPITKAQLQEAFNNAVESAGAKMADLKPQQINEGYRQLLTDMVMDKLVTKAASGIAIPDEEVNAEVAKIKQQFPSPEVFEAQIKASGMDPAKLAEKIRTSMQQRSWMKSQLAGIPSATEADAQKFYDAHPNDFKSPDQVKASHILFMVNKDDSADTVKKKEDAANKAYELAKKGGNFNDMAKEQSEEPGAKQTGGDLGFFTAERMVPEFSQAAFAMAVGDISKPVRSQFGFHVIKVTDKKPAGTMPFAEVKDQLLTYLSETNKREAVQNVLTKLQESAKIETTIPLEKTGKQE